MKNMKTGDSDGRTQSFKRWNGDVCQGCFDELICKSIIAQYSKDNPLHVLCDPSRYPYSYNENGEMKGTIPDYFRKIADYAGISYEFLTPATRDEYIAYQKNKEDRKSVV